MKRIFIIGFFALLGIQACKKDIALVDDKRPEERNLENVLKYKKELIGSTNGWTAYLYTNDIGGAYNFYLSFSDKDRVSMVADFIPESAAESKESSYQVKQVMVPTLIFDTYSYLHLLADPNPDEFGGNEGSGYGSDFEFEIREQKGDTLMLVGKKRNTKLVLIKATAEEKAFYTGGSFGTLVEDFDDYVSANPFLYIADPQDNTKRIQVSINPNFDVRTASFTSVDGGEIKSAQGLISYYPKGILLTQPLIYAGINFVAFEWDGTLGQIFGVTSAGTKIAIQTSATPILPLHLLMGTNYSAITVPRATNYPGWGTEFVTRRAAAATGVARFSLSGSALSLDRMQFVFNSALKTLNVVVITPYANTSLTLPYPYTYTKTIDGVYKFTLGTPTGNSAALIGALDPILAQRLNVDNFTLDYFVNPTSGQILGQFKSVNNPDFTFSGVLQ